jgi:hypothetical protein
MRDAKDEDTDRLWVSTDSPDAWDAKYPEHLLAVFLERADHEGRIVVGFMVERDVGEEDSVHEEELRGLLAPLVSRYRGSDFSAGRDREYEQPFYLRFEIPTHGETIGEALAIAGEALALVDAAEGTGLTLPGAVDLIRGGRGATLIGQHEGPWFDGKSAPYVLTSDDKRWELAKDVAAFANSEAGGVIFIGAKTKREHDGDVVSSVTDFELSLVSPPQYRVLIAARVFPVVEGLDVRTVPTQGTRGTAYIHVPPQRAELKPFVVKGVLVGGSFRASHVCIPGDGEDTRFSDLSEGHALLQAGRVALRQPDGDH